MTANAQYTAKTGYFMHGFNSEDSQSWEVLISAILGHDAAGQLYPRLCCADRGGHKSFRSTGEGGVLRARILRPKEVMRPVPENRSLHPPT